MSVICDVYYLCPCLQYVVCTTCVSMSDLWLYYLCVHVCNNDVVFITCVHVCYIWRALPVRPCL